MRLKVLDTVHISSISSETMRPNDVIEIDDKRGEELLAHIKHKNHFEKIVERASTKRVPKDDDAGGGAGAGEALTWPPSDEQLAAAKNDGLGELLKSRGLTDDEIKALNSKDKRREKIRELIAAQNKPGE